MSSGETQAIVGLAELAQILQAPDRSQERLGGALQRVHALLRSERSTLLVTRDGQSSLYAYPSPPRQEHEEPVARLAWLLREQVAAERAAPAVHSHLAMPLIAGEEEYGMILVERHSGEPFEEPSLQLLSVVASQLGAYIAHCSLTERDRRQHEAEASANEFQRLLVGVVSHDLRTPLGAILCGASLLLPRLIGERDAKVLGRMTNSAQRALRIINDLLDLTRAQSAGIFPITLRRCDAAALVREVVEEIRLAHHDRVVRLTGADLELPARLDPDRIAQALVNLLGNAVQYGAPMQAIDVSLVADDANVTYSVHNLGAPIAPEMLPRMFDPFLRGTKTSTGLGLGLYIVEQIVRAHGGHVRVTSSEAGGTAFSMTIARDHQT